MSQNEIDALLNALSTGEVDVQEIKEDTVEKRVKKYDFRNPQKIAKDQLRTLEIIHENFARLLQTFLSGYLRASVKVEVITVDQYAYSEFSNAISNPAFLSIVKFEPLSGQILLDISPNVAFTVIDRLLGGEGDSVSEIRNFTEIELILLKRMMVKVVDIVSEAWDNVIILTPSLEKIETNAQFAQIVPPSETISLITMNISVGEIEGLLNVCIPHLVIEPILNKLNTKLWFSTTKKGITEKDKEHLQKRIRNTYVPMVAELGSTTLTVRDLLDLQLGDVIKLKENVSDEISINVGSYKKFCGALGAQNRKVAVKITRAYKDGDELDG
ncbi:flagellar motor switch protein FliM [Gottschalkia acidurici 9a]|uniref:Flagellar motor switch protein FliM n=1 Tax=Gottschalkia acidurici (strain ATCC 7906 / DSM 604 / BCRC 14475 / CIP 104303 / KCTC 5404 / NCIMB 10678 / 9a) TaxID=1128398 RepID=K0AXQ5_GOTA9|nr:flagellar motor switch protein FliM [Gottschalkia acidurici]AFS78598.1 flagellar motor switch protein FliM [Gottschalkia acidurici 9a]